ncbi:NCS cytosine-purine permease [Cristinia sonorae]|uniref:NCS cytosine-purine permease n=1 Tax=Cristinia sonorae TaxID=1940300 RepID=A0A8K0ULZ4_9AGAR|nr:NCS cytosine-purine permease [Cristinia sonorae]
MMNANDVRDEVKGDVEKRSSTDFVEVDDIYRDKQPLFSNQWTRRLLKWGIEERGITPTAEHERIDTQFHKIFFIFLSANFNILSFSAGTLGPVVFGLGLRDSCLSILFFNLLCSIPPAYLTTWGPKLGLRQMCQARYSFGYYGVIPICIFDLASFCGFCILNFILGGQTLSSVSGGTLSWNVGIVVIGIISLLISFCGYRVLTWYERLAWIPVLVVYIVALGVSGKHLSNPPPMEPASAAATLSFASTLAGFVITYSPLSSDYTMYFHPKVSSWKLFWYAYLGFNIPIILVQCLGAAAAVSVSAVPEWNAGYESGSVGGLIEAMLHPVGGFGKFLTVCLALSVVANVAPTFYSFGLTFQVFLPFTAKVPRYAFSLLAFAIILPLSIVGSHKFYDTLTNFLGLIGYWCCPFLGVILVEHFYFRKGNFSTYDLSCWNEPSKLPTGVAAVGACLLSVALIIPSMEQVWYVGPIAKHTGDIGFEMAFAVSALSYFPLRTVELRYRKMV